MIGRWTGQKFHPQTGEPMDEKEYKQQFETWLPTAADKKLLMDIIDRKRNGLRPRPARKTAAHHRRGTEERAERGAVDQFHLSMA